MTYPTTAYFSPSTRMTSPGLLSVPKQKCFILKNSRKVYDAGENVQDIKKANNFLTILPLLWFAVHA